jgi:iron complex transport system substrate-binding protein
MKLKLFLILITLLLVLSACQSQPALPEPPPPTVEPLSEVAQPTPIEVIEPEAYPEPEEVTVNVLEEPQPYPEPQEQLEQPIPAGLSFTDDLDRTIVLAGPAQRIVTLGPSSLESLFAIGAGAQVVGREDFSTYPEEALAITSVGSLWGELPTEAILALEPDLVIAPEIISPEQIQTLEDLGLNVYFQANPFDFEGLWKNLRTLAALSGHETEADALIANLDARLQAVLEKTAPLSYRPSVFYELDATDPQNPYTIGAGTFISTIIDLAGGYNIGQVLADPYAPISSEEVIVQNPEIIVIADAPYGVTPQTVAERAGWDAINAVQNGAIFEFDPFLVSVPGPRLVDGLEAIAKILHPEVFE